MNRVININVKIKTLHHEALCRAYGDQLNDRNQGAAKDRWGKCIH
jgi:hypothetical protein